MISKGHHDTEVGQYVETEFDLVSDVTFALNDSVLQFSGVQGAQPGIRFVNSQGTAVLQYFSTFSYNWKESDLVLKSQFLGTFTYLNNLPLGQRYENFQLQYQRGGDIQSILNFFQLNQGNYLIQLAIQDLTLLPGGFLDIGVYSGAYLLGKITARYNKRDSGDILGFYYVLTGQNQIYVQSENWDQVDTTQPFILTMKINQF